jgi:hypothetical protein
MEIPGRYYLVQLQNVPIVKMELCNTPQLLDQKLEKLS